MVSLVRLKRSVPRRRAFSFEWAELAWSCGRDLGWHSEAAHRGELTPLQGGVQREGPGRQVERSASGVGPGARMVDGEGAGQREWREAGKAQQAVYASQRSRRRITSAAADRAERGAVESTFGASLD